MNEQALREELYAYYLNGDTERARSISERCASILNEMVTDETDVLEQKLMQYDVILKECEPKLFRFAPYFYETGSLTSLSDGSVPKGHSGFRLAGSWVADRNSHIYIDQDTALWAKKIAHSEEDLYLICGPYNDTHQHFNFNSRPYLTEGAVGIYNRALAELEKTSDKDERAFLEAICHGMLALRDLAGRFVGVAEEMLATETDVECIKNLTLIRDTACRIPWEAPKSFYEALAALAFLRTAYGTLEGVGPNTFGRVDKDLIDFYERDIASGALTPDEAYELVCQFLLIWDCHYDHDMKMVGYADHELENTYTIGGCTDDGEPLYNAVTEMFLRATRECGIIFPKIKCRYSKNSPKEYLDAINVSIVKGTSTVLLQNDDATIPALVRAGRPISEARDYMISGCWGLALNQEKYDHGNYLNFLKPFEISVHNLTDKIKKIEVDIEPIEFSDSFEDIYAKTLRNCERTLDAKLDLMRRGSHVFHKVDRFPIFSATLEDCLENHKDFHMGGARYRDDYQLIIGLPNIIDSLMAIKTLVFDKKKYTLEEYLGAVRSGWEGYENMRLDAICCHGWGDGNDDSCAMANRLNNDIYAFFEKKVGVYGGRVHMGHLTYTEIRWWAERTLATPDGRRNGEYFSQGLTPSRLKRIPSVNDVIYSMSSLDRTTLAANNVVNIILPGSISLDRCEAFIRATAESAVQSLQLNCVSRETLLDAQIHPELYPNLIVRVTGFSAKFTSLSRGWQDEVISRNFYD